MHELFANWYSQVSPQMDSKRLDDRWKAVDAYGNALTTKKTTGVVLLASGIGDGKPTGDELRQAAKKVDTTYVSSDDALELKVLAAAVIARSLGVPSDQSDALALGYLCVSFSRKLLSQMHEDLHRLCLEYIVKEGIRIRDEGITFPPLNAKTTTELLKKQPEAPDGPTARLQMHEAVTQLLKSASEYADESSKSFARLHDLQREDSNVAFLVVSAYAFTTGEPFSEMTRAEAALIAAHELACVTKLTPVLVAHDAVLSALLKHTKGRKDLLSIREAVNGVKIEVQKRLIGTAAIVPEVMPCHFALQKAVEVNGKDVWNSAFATATGLNPDDEHPTLDLVRQAYLEGMLRTVLAS